MKLALFGYGRMGRAVESVARERGHEVTSMLDDVTNPEGRGISAESVGGATLAVDFSTAEAVLPNVRRATELGMGLVIGTTGWERDREAVEAEVLEADTALIHSPNFSVGMLFFTRLVDVAARMANGLEDYDVHLWEAHHRHKTDHPSGTARRLADTLVQRLERKQSWSLGLQEGEAHPPHTLQVSVTRAGEIPGTHEVGFEGPDDRIQLRHEARNRMGFARGAVLAAEWLEGRRGIFTMSDLMDDLLG
jgi:4-hydroxy-tetrahydrodipicolinate reductase